METTIPQLFEAQVERTPDAIAGIFGTQQLNYRELNTKANQLARYLRGLGVGVETLVGICVARSLDTAIALLGVLKAGGAYVPLDPAYPQERLAFMLSDTKVPVLLTQHPLIDSIPTFQGDLVCLDTDWHKIALECEDNLDGLVNPDNLAYITYTSGSTGKPKGAMMPHRAVCQSWRWLQDTHPYYASDRVLHKASLSFDVSSRWELFWPLMAGACIVFARPGGDKDSTYLVKLINNEQISVVYFVATMLSLFLGEHKAKTCQGIRQMFVGGEAFPFALKQRLWKTLPACDTIEIYGSTETIVVSSWHCRPEPESRNFAITRPIVHLPIYILDENKHPVPMGKTGELYVGGDYLVKGYLNRPKLTAERFICNPFVTDDKEAVNSFSRHSENRLYKTGDLVRTCADGTMELLGRSDHQVKIRGFRVELGEVESVLVQHPDVRQAAVILRADDPGNQRLVAYVACTSPEVASQKTLILELRTRIQNTLPDYMMPAAFVVLDKLPLTPNGKLDRRSLPCPTPERPLLLQSFVPPQSDLEKTLAHLWSQVLHIDPIGINDDFFELGGNSLLAIQLLFQVRHTFESDFPLSVLLKKPTIANMVDAITNDRSSPLLDEVPGMTVEELATEAIFDPDLDRLTCAISPSLGSHKDPNNILLTGATGFLGAFLLDELLKKTQANIYCLVRGCQNPEEAKQKVIKNCNRYWLKYEQNNPRIIPITGDLAQPHLGLEDQQFEHLTQQVDVIYHVATFLNLAYPYTAMRKANVGGTQEIIKLACQNKLKPIHFVSSPAVFKAEGYANKPLIQEDDPLESCEVVYGGYGQSKWVAEKLLNMALHRGIPVSIYRPGTISGHSQTGAYNTEQTFGRLLKSFITHGTAPELKIEFDLTPVDYVSQAIVHLSKQQQSIGKKFHLVNSQCWSMGELANRLCDLGYPVTTVDYLHWKSMMQEIILQSPNDSLGPILPFLTQKIPGTNHTYFEASSFMERLDCGNTLHGLANADITCPLPNNELLQLQLKLVI